MRATLIALLTLALLGTATASEEVAREPALAALAETLGVPPVMEPLRDLLAIHLQSVENINPERTLPHRLNTPADAALVVRVAQREAALVEELDLESAPFAADHRPEAFDTRLVSRIYRFAVKWSEPLTPEEIEAHRQRLRDDLTGPDRLHAKQIFVEINAWTDREAARAQAEAIFARLASEEFYAVARDYYGTVGLAYDGRVGWLQRGAIPEERFRPLWEAPWLGRPFGPLEQEAGFLIAQVDERHPEGLAPAEALGSWFEGQARRERAREALAACAASQETVIEVVRHPLEDGELLSADTPLLTIGDQTWTAQEILGRAPMNDSDAERAQTLRERVIERELLLRGPAAAWVRGTAAHRWLADAHRHAWLVDQHLQGLFEDQVDTSDAAVERFWREHLDTRHRRPDQISLTTVHIPVTRPETNDPVAQRLARREAFTLARHLRAAWVADPRREALAPFESEGEFTVETDSPRSLNAFAPPIQAAVHPLAVGESSEIVIRPTEYLICRLDARTLGEPIPLAEIEGAVRFNSELAQRLALREALLGIDLDLDAMMP